MDRIGILRLEKFYRHERAIYSDSGVSQFIEVLGRSAVSLRLMAPLCRSRAGRKPPGEEAEESAMGERFLGKRANILALPNVSGYVRVYLLLPIILFNLIRMRIFSRTLICRVPEHGNLLILPLLRMLRFNLTIWLVSDREGIRRLEGRRRRKGLRLSIGLLLNAWTERMEDAFLRRYPVIANGSPLAGRAERLKGAPPGDAGQGSPAAQASGGRAVPPGPSGGADVLTVFSSVLPEKDFPDYSEREIAPGLGIDLLFVGRLSVEKGLWDLLEAMARLKEGDGRPYRLNLVGWSGHQEEERLRQETETLGLRKDVRFLGRKRHGAELYACYRSAHLFVLPSHTEGTPRVLVEALAFGLPVVATRVGGIGDLIEEGVNGLLVPPGDPAALARAVAEIAGDPGRYARISRANFRKARMHSAEALARSIIGFIERGQGQGAPMSLGR